MTQEKKLARILQKPLCDPHLGFGRFVETNSFLAAALGSVSRGYRPHPPGPSINGLAPAEEGAVPWLTSGAKAERPRSSGPAPQGLSPPGTPRSPLLPSRKRRPRGPARGQPGRRHTPRSASPAARPQAGRRPAPPLRPRESWRSRSRDPHNNGAAGNWPLDFLRPVQGWGRPVGGTRKLRLPPSCFRPGGELGVGVRAQGPRRDARGFLAVAAVVLPTCPEEAATALADRAVAGPDQDSPGPPAVRAPPGQCPPRRRGD